MIVNDVLISGEYAQGIDAELRIQADLPRDST
jgi:hypothetical protein